ncbi:replication protein [Alteromonas macleodii]|uniref:replication protein n=1 Tax=Alteromonas macleodii TaxID=28108 RepID=UPI003CFF1C72
MQQAAENVYQLNQHRPVVKADTKEGFIMLASTINAELGKFGTYKLNGRERALIDCVIQKTFGFKKKSDWISESQFAEFMDLSEGTTGNINKIKRSLIKRKILVEDGRKVGINTVISEWVPYQSQSKTTETKTSQKRLEKQSNLTIEQSKTTEKAVKFDPHKRKETNTKDNYTKDNCRVAAPKPSSVKQKKSDVKSEILALPIPTGLSLAMWEEWVESRSENKKPMTLRSAKMQISKLEEWQAKGHDLDDIVKTSIANNYQGLFEPKGNPQGRTFQSHQERMREENMRVMSNWANKE